MFDSRLSPFTRLWIVLVAVLWVLTAGWVVYELRVTSDDVPIDFNPLWGLTAFWGLLILIFPVVSILPAYEHQHDDLNGHYYAVLLIVSILVLLCAAIVVDTAYSGVKEILIPEGTTIFDTELYDGDYRCTMLDRDLPSGGIYWRCEPTD